MLLLSFAFGGKKDKAEMHARLNLPHNDLVEGKVNKLKSLKRMGDG
jgi:hypothetical protein